MTLTQILAALPNDKWIGNSIVDRYAAKHLSNKELKLLIRYASKALASRNVKEASNYFYFGFLTASDRFLDAVRTDGVFRTSRFAYEAEVGEEVIAQLLEAAHLVAL